MRKSCGKEERNWNRANREMVPIRTEIVYFRRMRDETGTIIKSELVFFKR